MMIDLSNVHALLELEFLELPNQHWQTAVDRTVLASVRAFSFLHKVRFGGLPKTVLPDLDPDHNEEDSDDAGRGKRFQRKPHRSTTDAPQDYTDSDTPENADGLGERSQSREKACLPLTNQGMDVSPADMAVLPSTARTAGSPTPSSSPQLRTSCDVSRPPSRQRRMPRQSNSAALGLGHPVTVKGPSHRGRSLPISAASSSSLVRSSTRFPTLNTVSTRPASSFAFHACCAVAKSSRTAHEERREAVAQARGSIIDGEHGEGQMSVPVVLAEACAHWRRHAACRR